MYASIVPAAARFTMCTSRVCHPVQPSDALLHHHRVPGQVVVSRATLQNWRFRPSLPARLAISTLRSSSWNARMRLSRSGVECAPQ